jgi:hypothetical protein
MELLIPKKELKSARARNIVVLLKDIMRIEELDHCLARVLLGFEEPDDVPYLV